MGVCVPYVAAVSSGLFVPTVANTEENLGLALKSELCWDCLVGGGTHPCEEMAG